MEVTDVLRDRMQEPGGLRVTALVSLLFHSLLAAALIYGPIRWLAHPADKDKPVMTISLGGAGTGPQVRRTDVDRRAPGPDDGASHR